MPALKATGKTTLQDTATPDPFAGLDLPAALAKLRAYAGALDAIADFEFGSDERPGPAHRAIQEIKSIASRAREA